MMIVMPSAMIPIGADCFRRSSMLSKSMKAFSDTDRNSPAMEKKASSNRMKTQIAPCLTRLFRLSAFMPGPSCDRRPEPAALGGNVEPYRENDDGPCHDILRVERESHEKKAVLDESEDQDTDHRLEDRARPAEKRRAAKNDRGEHLELHPLPHGVLAAQRTARLEEPRRGHAEGGDEIGVEHDTRPRYARECRRRAVTADGVDFPPERRLRQHDAEHDRQSREHQDGNRHTGDDP